MKGLPFVALLMTLLSGCSLFQVHTNLDKENFTDYFKPSSVAVLDKTQVLAANATPIGTVDGDTCQSKNTQAPPNETDAQTSARRKVADMGGNAVVFGKCISMPATTECVSSIVCYGQAYKIQDRE
jgi:RcsF protein